MSFLQTKDQTPDAFRSWEAVAKCVMGKKVKSFLTNQGTEFSKLRPYFQAEGINYITTIEYTHEVVGMAERMMRTIFEGVRTLFADVDLDRCYWAYASKYVVWTRNQLPYALLDGKSPYKVIFDKKTFFCLYSLLWMYCMVSCSKGEVQEIVQKIAQRHLCWLFEYNQRI